jgi:outer membrane receptor for Fe3+-dicitrate
LPDLADGAEKTTNVKMTDASKEMEIVVVTGSKYEKKLGEETVSLEVLRGQNITQSNQNLSEAVNKVPGVNMLGRTISQYEAEADLQMLQAIVYSYYLMTYLW